MLDSIVASQGSNTKTYSPKRALPDPGVGKRWARVITTPEYCKKKGLPIRNILEYPLMVAKSFSSIPDVFQRTIASKEENPVTLTEPVQRWVYARFRECAPKWLSELELLKAWLNAFESAKAFCNGTGVNKIDEITGEYLYADFIGGTGLDKKGFKLWATICRGALVKVSQEAYWGGEWRVQIEVMDVFDPATLTKTYKGNEHLFTPAISWNRMWINPTTANPYGTPDPAMPYGRANPFPHFGDDRSTIVPIPLLGKGVKVSYLPREWIEYLNAGDPYPNFYWENF